MSRFVRSLPSLVLVVLLSAASPLPALATDDQMPEATDPAAPEAEVPSPAQAVIERERAMMERLEGTIIIRGEVQDAAGQPIDGVDVRIIPHTLEHPEGAPPEYDTVDHRFVFRFDDVISVYLQFTRGEHLISELEAYRALPVFAGQPQSAPQDFTTTVRMELVEHTVDLPEVTLLLSHLPDGSYYVNHVQEGEDSLGRRLPVFRPERVSGPIHDLYPPFLAAGLEEVDYDLEPLRDQQGRALSPRNAVGQLHLDDGGDGGFLFFEPDDERLNRFQVMRRMTQAPESGYERTITFLAENYAYVDRLDPLYVWAKLEGYYAKGWIERVYYGPEGFHVVLRLRIQPDGSRHLATMD